MIVSYRYGFVFVKTSKTAGSSIEVALSPLCDDTDVFTPLTPPEDGHRPRNHLALRDTFNKVETRGPAPAAAGSWLNLAELNPLPEGALAHLPAWYLEAAIPEVWSSSFTFCVERNPWDRLVSAFHHHLSFLEANGKPRPTFSEFLPLGVNVLTRASHYCDANGRVMVDAVIRYENLESELAETLGCLGVPFNGLTSRAKSGLRPAGSYRDYYTDRDVGLVAESFAREISLFGYQF